MIFTRICILGSNGLLGGVLSVRLREKKNKLFLISKSIPKQKKNNFYSLDINNKKKLEKLLVSIKPDIIINCVAYTDVTRCEKYKKKAIRINSELLKNLLNVLNKINLKAHIIHISTDQVYNNVVGRINKEKDINLSNYYSVSKFKGEKILKKYKKKTILRTNFFGRSEKSMKKSFSEMIFNSYHKKRFIKLPYNIFFNPVSFKTIIKVIKIIIKNKIYGIYNLGSNGIISKYKFAELMLKKKKLNKSFLIPYHSVYKKNKRPLNTAMNVGKIEKKIGFKMPYINQSIRLGIN